jgi:hypothetical protein
MIVRESSRDAFFKLPVVSFVLRFSTLPAPFRLLLAHPIRFQALDPPPFLYLGPLEFLFLVCPELLLQRALSVTSFSLVVSVLRG